MRRSLLALLAAAALALPGAAPASEPAPPPPGDISDNVEFIANLPEASMAIAVGFIGDTLFVSTVTGIFSYDISDPAAPELLGVLPMYIWQNEDMDIDVERELLFVSRDPRGFTTQVSSGSTFPYGAVHIVDVSNPAAMLPVSNFLVPAGHTSTCVNGCDYLWTGGPTANTRTNPGMDGRPIYATDITDPMAPVACPDPIDIARNDGITDYAHDVQVDAMGVAWVSGAGGVRGYWTSGEHLDPTTGETREATGCDPVPYGGGGTPSSATPSRFMHNSQRNLALSIPDQEDSEGMVLAATEEAISSNCASSGRLATYDVRSSLQGQGWNEVETFRMRALDTWTPEGAEGATGCASAHYFDDRGDGLLAHAFYGQGVRFLDISDPTDIRQVGYFRPDEGNAWAAYWRGDLVFIPHNGRGVDIVRYDGDGGGADPLVTAPTLAVALPPMDPASGYLCPLT